MVPACAGRAYMGGSVEEVLRYVTWTETRVVVVVVQA